MPKSPDIKFRGGVGSLWVLLRRGHEMSIAALYDAAYPHSPCDESRLRQQRVGKSISAMNARLAKEGFKIMPGNARRTYRLRRVG